MRVNGPAAGWLSMVCLLGACSGSKTPARVEQRTGGGELLTVQRGQLVDRVLLTGELDAVTSDEFSVPRTRMWNLSIRKMVDDGSRVTKGDKIVEFDNSSFIADLSEKQLAADSAYNDLARQRSQGASEIADKEFATEQARIALEKARIDAAIPAEASALRTYQEKQLALKRAASAFAKAGDDMQAARTASELEEHVKQIAFDKALREITQAESVLDSLALRASRDGLAVVAMNRREDRKVKVGDGLWPGMVVMKLPDLSKMKVIAQLSDVDDGRIAIGMKARCMMDAYPDIEWAATVTEISPVAKETTSSATRRSFEVILALEQTDSQKMRPGMSVRVEIDLEPVDGLLAPRAALDPSSVPPRAHSSERGVVTVELGPCNAQQCVVQAGLSENTPLLPFPGSL